MTAASTDPLPDFLVPRRYRSAATAVSARARRARRLGPVLDALLAERDAGSARERDPVRFVHRHSTLHDQELVALVASSLAYGNVRSIGQSVERVLEVLGPRPAAAAAQAGRLEAALGGFVHRWTRGADVAALLLGAASVQAQAGSLGAAFAAHLETQGTLRAAVGAFADGLRAAGTPKIARRRGHPRGLAYLFPDGRGPGACKRVHLFLRWMVRGPDGVDLGLWPLSPSVLLMPLDTHTFRLCRSLGLTRRGNAGWRTAEEVTWNLRGIDPEDPVKYDFALAHLGIARDCRHRREVRVCARCALESVCRPG